MNRSEALGTARRYMKLNEQFTLFCENLSKSFPPGNEYGLEFGDGDSVSKDFLIFNQPSKVEFSFEINNGSIIGLISFYRLDNSDDKILIARIYFDQLGNWKPSSDDKPYLHNFNDSLDYTNHLSVIILGGFFDNPIH